MRKRYLGLVIGLLFSLQAVGQIAFQFVPELNGRTVDGILSCRVVNTGGATLGSLGITVTEKRSGKIMAITVPQFRIMPGSNTIPAAAARAAKIEFGSSALGQFARRNGIMGAGEYEYCFSVNQGPEIPPVEDCFDSDMTPFAAMDLIEPAEREEICEPKPMLSWQPLMPFVPGATYQVLLTEIKAKQTPAEALNYNLPLVNVDGITSSMIQYPAASRELEQGKRYAWQVTAIKDQVVLNRSEVWEFIAKCPTEPSAAKDANGYRDIEDLTKGNFYVAVEEVRFALLNPGIAQRLTYSIQCVSKPGMTIRRLPVIKLSGGRNKVLLDLRNNKSFVDGYSYVMTIQLPGGGVRNLRFLYKAAL
jgi:hypothetical protein